MSSILRWLKFREWLKHKRKLKLLAFAKEHPDDFPTMLYYRIL